MRIEIDGNDGVGKTVFVNALRKLYPTDVIVDRGELSKATLHKEWERKLEKNEIHDFKSMLTLDPHVCYILLDTYPKQCQERILLRGDSIDEPYHNMDDLLLFQRRFLILATSNKQRSIPIYMTYMPFGDNMSRIVNYINGFRINLNKMNEIVIGTTNKGKIREIASILSPLGFNLTPIHLEVNENGKTIIDNAEIKAKEYSSKSDGRLTIVEDSGLVIPGLNNLPGAFSARFFELEVNEELEPIKIPKEKFSVDKTDIDAKNNKRLVEMIKNIPFDKRGAYFEVCFIVSQNGKILFKTVAKSYGHIIDELRGDNGFGYDPLFIGNDTYGKTYAELDSARKNLRSHRKRALREVALWLSLKYK